MNLHKFYTKKVVIEFTVSVEPEAQAIETCVLMLLEHGSVRDAFSEVNLEIVGTKLVPHSTDGE